MSPPPSLPPPSPPRPPDALPAAAPRFLCDEMLGKLARWLRLLGHDTVYLQHVDDDALLRHALNDGRTLLTRDAALAARAPPGVALRIRALEPEAQLREVVQALGLGVGPSGTLSRCTLCNHALEAAAPDAVAAEVPAAVRATQQAYWRCPGCGKVYWHGTHVARIEAQLHDLLDPGSGGRGIDADAGAERGA